MIVVAPVCGCENATPTPKLLTFMPAQAENPDKKLRLYVDISVRVL